MKEPKQFTHKQLVRIVANWLKNCKRHKVVITELSTVANETPDVLSFHDTSSSTLVEVKASRSDFLADKKKLFRKCEAQGMGDYRYFAAPKGVIKPEELPEGWGLLEVSMYEILSGTKERTVISTTAMPSRKEGCKRAEMTVLLSVMRRLEIATCVYVRAEEPDLTGDNDTA